jgi:putative addiction module CopG family antidote
MTTVTLSADQESFATDAIARGGFRDVPYVIRAAVDLLRRSEALRAAFEATLDDAVAEGEQDGFMTLDGAMRDSDALLEELAKPRL